ncbi:methylamine utilization protein MauJ [Desulfocurvibacter africanus]|uniref:methylamine utilization protein MauJ n=1 Tax=Desulfocurvibacter africanus TaxID=873 RepID=UPI002FD8A22F
MPASYWATIGFNFDGKFQSNDNFVTYQNYKLEVVNGDDETNHSIHIQIDRVDSKNAHELARKFLSELCWLYNIKIRDIYHYSGSGKFKVKKTTKNIISYIELIPLEDYEQIATNDHQRLALGFYREAISSNSELYSFLSYFKIFNIKFKSGGSQKHWLNTHIDSLENSKEIIESLRSKEIIDIGKHLYASGRCAIAHANIESGDPIVDIDNMDDINRIRNELPIVQKLATIFLRKELNIISEHELRKKRMMRCLNGIYNYKLIGLVHPKYLIKLASSRELRLSVGLLRSGHVFKSFSNILFKLDFLDNSHAILSNGRSDFPVLFRCEIDFDAQHIAFDLRKNGLRRPAKTISDIILLDYYIFLKELICNARIELTTTCNNSFFTRLDPFIATNISFGASTDKLGDEIKQIKKRLKLV